jgi:hypothetical protein
LHLEGSVEGYTLKIYTADAWEENTKHVHSNDGGEYRLAITRTAEAIFIFTTRASNMQEYEKYNGPCWEEYILQ